MKLNAPTQTFFYISVALAVLGLLGRFGGVKPLAEYDFLLVLAGYAVLFIGVVMKNR
jgi:hypothetical protein